MSKTLNDLDPPSWGPAPADATRLVARSHALRDKPVVDFSVEDLRLMIEQQIGLSHLVPLALGYLEENALVAGDFYRGDLLRAVLTVDKAFWEENRELEFRASSIIDELETAIRDLAEPIARFRAQEHDAYGVSRSE